jgi:alpha-beta hydrolase superfamily lysophospholipase
MFVFGHSMGSLIALAYLTHHSDDLAGAVLCGVPADVDGAPSLAPTLEAFADVRDQPAANLLVENNAPFEPSRTPFDWLSRDQDEVDRYLADPLCGYGNPLTYGYLIDLLGVVAPARKHLGSIRCPVLVIVGEHDSAAAMGAHAMTLARALEAAGVEVRTTVYDDARHELLNEINRDEVIADIVDWLDVR